MTSKQGSFWFTPNGLASLGLIGAASYFLLIEHRQHLFQWLPFLILALCPLMHVFMHRGHGGHGSHEHHDPHKTEESEDVAYRHGYEAGKKDSEHKEKGHAR